MGPDKWSSYSRPFSTYISNTRVVSRLWQGQIICEDSTALEFTTTEPWFGLRTNPNLNLSSRKRIVLASCKQDNKNLIPFFAAALLPASRVDDSFVIPLRMLFPYLFNARYLTRSL